jgi:DNA polymerase-3 subunit epsilon/CBS domain-containing protein
MSFQGADDSLSGLPLGAVPAVALDLETTGLDVASDRIVEIAAVRLQGAGGEDDRFTRLVSPGIPIPASSTRIHGITDDEVAGAEAFAAVIPEFGQWVGRSLVIGYALGFDLAVLKAEHQRHGLDWTAPRSIDVRHLVQLVAPDLPNQSLELAAKWLGVEVGERHRALGDAETAARIFKALVPRLREKGIVTLAQAERVCRNLRTRLEEEAQAGWHEVLRDSRIAPESVAEYARIDSFPYRHRVYDVMRFPAVSLPPATPVREALALMMEKGISSVFVDPPEDQAGPGGSYSILTERDLLRAFNSNVAGVRDAPISHYAKGPLVTVESEEFVYRAIATMSQRGFRHLGVRDPDGKLVGAISARDLLRQRAGDALSLGDSLERAASPGDLGRIWSDLTTVARGLVFEEADPRDIAAIISRELRALTRRACELAEAEMARRGEGPPPRPYALMVLGSGGRGESLLAMDQDNAIIFDEGEAGGEADRWFEQLGTLVADMLNEAGVIYCPGGIMASNAEWRLDLAGWRRRLETWITNARPEDLLNSDIFFDAVAVYGERALAETLYDEAQAAAGGSRNFLMAMTLKASDFRPPLNWLGRPRLENGRIDLKKSGLMPIFSAARIAALTHKLDVRSTPERLEGVRQLGEFDGAVIGRLIDAHKVLLGAILRQQLRDIQHGIALSNKVAPSEMPAHERQELTWALGQVESVRDLLGTPVIG